MTTKLKKIEKYYEPEYIFINEHMHIKTNI